MGRRFGKQTAPGFADPAAPVSLDRPVEDEGIDIATEHADTAADPAVGAAVSSPAPVAAPAVSVREHGGADRQAVGPSAPVRTSAARPGGKSPMVEVEVSYERGPAPRALPLQRWLELWTQNSIYVLDSRMRCIEVRSPAGEPSSDHPFVGTRLVGGQWQSEEGVELSYPLPRPGSCAVFEGHRGTKRRFSRTSAVERVVMRLQVVAVTGPNMVPAWEDLIEE